MRIVKRIFNILLMKNYSLLKLCYECIFSAFIAEFFGIERISYKNMKKSFENFNLNLDRNLNKKYVKSFRFIENK